MQITFIRHAETVGNVSHVWQGQGDSPLSPAGERQAADLGRRPSMHGFDLVVSSDLARVAATARFAGHDPEIDPAWREVDVGRWEGLTADQVAAGYPEELEALHRGDDLPLGGGESWVGFAGRVDAALSALRDRCDPGDRVAVFTHGGVIHSLMAGHLGLRRHPRPLPFDRLRNTSATVLEYGSDGAAILRVFNDASHTATSAHRDETGPVVALIRHGETLANLAGRWHGITDGPLSEGGIAQAASLAASYDGIAHVYSSHLSRARETAAALARAAGTIVAVRGDLHEIHFGAWEDHTPEEIRDRYPDDWRAVYVENRDLPRGGTGETAGAAGRRMARAVEEMAAAHPGGRVAAVTHGGSIRAYAADVVGLGFDNRSHLALPGNTEVAHIRMSERGPVLTSYNMRPGR